MNKIKSLLVIGILTAAFAVGAQTTQTNASGGLNITTNAIAGTPEGNFFTQAYDWIQTANTGDPNKTWLNSYAEISDGYSQETGSGAMDLVEGQYDWANGIVAGGYGQFAGVGSAFNGGGVLVGYEAVRYYSVKGELDIMAGYDKLAANTRGGFNITPRITLLKWNTDYLATKIGIGIPIQFKGKQDYTPKIFAELTIPFRFAKQ